MTVSLFFRDEDCVHYLQLQNLPFHLDSHSVTNSHHPKTGCLVCVTQTGRLVCVTQTGRLVCVTQTGRLVCVTQTGRLVCVTLN